MSRFYFFISKFLIASPFYPHWLEFRGSKKLKNYTISRLAGRVLEVGAGNGQFKKEALNINNLIKEFVATDFTSWDENFKAQADSGKKLGGLLSAFIGPQKRYDSVDFIADARELPFESDSFDCYCSFEVMEHIDFADRVVSESYRVLKKGGLAFFSIPFMYREHGGADNDYRRYTRHGFLSVMKNAGYSIEPVLCGGFIGTTITSMINSFVIRRIFEGLTAERLLFAIFCPIIFLATNLFGYVVDCIYEDPRFATRYLFVGEKQDASNK